MSPEQLTICDTIIKRALPLVPFDGWTAAVLAQAAEEAGYDPDMAAAVFPGGVGDALAHFADFTDRAMLEKLEHTDVESLRVRDRIRQAVLARLEVLAPFREAERRALCWWSLFPRALRGSKIVWRTADRIWLWAGDTAQDYNRYTKRALLGGVIGATTLAWLADEGQDRRAVEDFLDRRIEGVLRWGRRAGKFRNAG